MNRSVILLFLALTSGASAADCSYVDGMGDRASYDFAGHLDIRWAPVNGAPEATESCTARPAGTGMIQVQAQCGKNDYWFGVGPAHKGGKSPDIMSLDGMIWYRTCN